MIREWLRPDGTTARFDSVTEIVEYRGADGEIVIEGHVADLDERAEYLSFYPDATQEEVNARNAIAGQLSTALSALRSATADNIISPAEFVGANPLVQAALLSYRDYPYEHKDVDRLAFLVLSQVSFAYSLLLAQSMTRAATVGQSLLVLNTKVAELENAVNALTAGP
jgi:hypothetical protein